MKDRPKFDIKTVKTMTFPTRESLSLRSAGVSCKKEASTGEIQNKIAELRQAATAHRRGTKKQPEDRCREGAGTRR